MDDKDAPLPDVVPGTDYVSSVYLHGPPLLPVGQMGLAKNDVRRLDMEKDDLCTTFAVVTSECSLHTESTRRGFTLVACEDDPSVVGVVPYVSMIPGLIGAPQRQKIVRDALWNHRRRADANTARHKQEKMYRSLPKACGDAAVATPRTPIGASTSRLETMVSPVCGMTLAPGVQEADTEEKNAQVRRKKRLNRTKGGSTKTNKKKKKRPSVGGGSLKQQKRARTGNEPRPPQRVITSASLAASKAS